MSGLTTAQQWGHDHIIRCTCGSWLMVQHWQLEELRNDIRPTCPHVRAAAMGDAA
jgi:hypothetical protein